MTEEWKKFRPKRADGRENGESRLRTLYLVFRRYEKRVAIGVGVLLVLTLGWQFLPRITSLFHRTPRADDTRVEARNLAMTVRVFAGDMGRLPTEQEGLQALAKRPDSQDVSRWKGPYLYEVPSDRWGQPFVYRTNGTCFVVMSPGGDRQPKTADDIRVFFPDQARAGFLLADK